MVVKRRMGTAISATRDSLMDGVETVMREKGYAALTARNVAEAVGVKHQLVYYYYETMEHLLLAAYRRRTGQVLRRVEQALASERPLEALWGVHSDPAQAALTIEYMALANHNEGIRVETVAFGEHMRSKFLPQVTSRRNSSGLPDELNSFAVSMVIMSIGSIVGMEAALGISGGHAEVRALIQWSLAQLDNSASS